MWMGTSVAVFRCYSFHLKVTTLNACKMYRKKSADLKKCEWWQPPKYKQIKNCKYVWWLLAWKRSAPFVVTFEHTLVNTNQTSFMQWVSGKWAHKSNEKEGLTWKWLFEDGQDRRAGKRFPSITLMSGSKKDDLKVDSYIGWLFWHGWKSCHFHETYEGRDLITEFVGGKVPLLKRRLEGNKVSRGKYESKMNTSYLIDRKKSRQARIAKKKLEILWKICHELKFRA